MIGFLLGMVCGAGLLLVACQVYKALMVKLTSPALMRAIHERLDAHAKEQEYQAKHLAWLDSVVAGAIERARGRSV